MEMRWSWSWGEMEGGVLRKAEAEFRISGENIPLFHTTVVSRFLFLLLSEEFIQYVSKQSVIYMTG
jgi:hypothetical protein